MRYYLLFATLLFFSTLYSYDVVIYGGTSAGIIAAIQSARMGKSVVVIAQGRHLGGMTSNGVSVIDATDATLIGGVTHEFFHRIWLYYQDEEKWIWEKPRPVPNQLKKTSPNTAWVVEPHVAEKIFNQMLSEENISIILEERLQREGGVKKEGARIVQIAMESGAVFSGDIFIDASYEGDLMAASGVSYTVGRESNTLYNEELNGIRYTTYFPIRIDPYIIPKNPSSGLLPRIFPNSHEKNGEGNACVQAYNYRMSLTDVPENGVPIEKPENYDELNYEILFRAIEGSKKITPFFKFSSVPNRKIDANHSGAVSTDYTGMSWDYAEADYATREKIAYEHEMWQRGLVWTLQNHPRIPEEIRALHAPYSLPKDEFGDNGNWPYELYVREARRMISNYVITEHVALSKEVVEDSIGIASYPIDSHAIKYYVNDAGYLKNEGGIFVKLPKPFSISYKAVIPKREECQNLLVPLCLSATHVAYGSIRMEPVFMLLGQSVATAACLSLENGCAVQDLPYPPLQKQLLKDRQVLD